MIVISERSRGKFHDPKGTLLTPEQRIEHVAQLLPIAVGLTLREDGWQLDANPGLLYFHKDGQKLNVVEILGQLRSGSFPREQWFELSNRLGIADLIIKAAETKPAFKEA